MKLYLNSSQVEVDSALLCLGTKGAATKSSNSLDIERVAHSPSPGGELLSVIQVFQYSLLVDAYRKDSYQPALMCRLISVFPVCTSAFSGVKAEIIILIN